MFGGGMMFIWLFELWLSGCVLAQGNERFVIHEVRATYFAFLFS